MNIIIITLVGNINIKTPELMKLSNVYNRKMI